MTGRIDTGLRQHAQAGPRARTLTTLPGVGQFTALVMLAEIGDITRFPSARQLASWVGLTPTVRGPGPDRPARAHPGQGSAWLRWVVNQAAQTARRSPQFAASYAGIAKRRGKKIATIAIARKLLTRAWHLLADMQAASMNEPPRRPQNPRFRSRSLCYPRLPIGLLVRGRPLAQPKEPPPAGRIFTLTMGTSAT